MSNIKLNYKELNKIVQCPPTFDKLLEAFATPFKLTIEEVKQKGLCYVDKEGDMIQLTTEEDFNIFTDYIAKNTEKVTKVSLLSKEGHGFGHHKFHHCISIFYLVVIL